MEKIESTTFINTLLKDINIPHDFSMDEIFKHFEFLLREVMEFNGVLQRTVQEKNIDYFSLTKYDLRKLITPIFSDFTSDKDKLMFSVAGYNTILVNKESLKNLTFVDYYSEIFSDIINFKIDTLFFYLIQKRKLFVLDFNGNLSLFDFNNTQLNKNDKYLYNLNIFKEYPVSSRMASKCQYSIFINSQKNDVDYKDIYEAGYKSSNLNNNISHKKLTWKDAANLEMLLRKSKIKFLVRKQDKLYFKPIDGRRL